MSSSAANGVHIAIQRLPHGADLALPAPATEASAGADLLAAVTVCPNGDNTRYYSVPGKDLVRPLAIEIYDTGVQPREFPRWTDWRPAWTGKWMPLES